MKEARKRTKSARAATRIALYRRKDTAHEPPAVRSAFARLDRRLSTDPDRRLGGCLSRRRRGASYSARTPSLERARRGMSPAYFSPIFVGTWGSSTIRSPAAARRGDGASAGFALALSADRDPQRSAGGSRTESQRWGSAKANRRSGLCRVPDKGSWPRCCGLAGLSTPPQVARGKPVDARRACLVTPKRSS